MTDQIGTAQRMETTPDSYLGASATQPASDELPEYIFAHPDDTPEQKAFADRIREQNPGTGDFTTEDPTRISDSDQNLTQQTDAPGPDNEQLMMKVDGRMIPAQASITGPDAESIRLLAQKGLGAETRFAKAREMIRQAERFEPLIQKLAGDPEFARHVLSYGLEPGQLSDFVAANSRKAIAADQPEQQQTEAAEPTEIMAVMAQHAADISLAKDQLSRRGMDSGDFEAHIPMLADRVRRLLLSPDPADREYGSRLNNDPEMWVTEYLMAKVAGDGHVENSISPTIHTRIGNNIETRLAARTALPRDTSRVETSDGLEDWQVLTQRALKSGREDDFLLALSERLDLPE